MVTIEDRSVLAEGARRTRGIQPQARKQAHELHPLKLRSLPKAPKYASVSQKSAESAIAISIYQQPCFATRSLAPPANKGDVERSELMNYLRAQNDAFDNQARILIDSALAESLSGKPDERNSIQVRVYDLDDLRAATIRSKIKPLQADAHFILLTLKQ